jgi:ferredoxin
MKVWIDPHECTGAGTCEQIAPEVFQPRSDGVWAVKEEPPYFDRTTVFDGENAPGHGPEGSAGLARVPTELLDSVIDAAEDCPAECIYLEA